MHVSRWEGPALSTIEFMEIRHRSIEGVTMQPHAEHENLTPIAVYDEEGTVMWPLPLAMLSAVCDEDGNESGFFVWQLKTPLKLIEKDAYDAYMRKMWR